MISDARSTPAAVVCRLLQFRVMTDPQVASEEIDSRDFKREWQSIRDRILDLQGVDPLFGETWRQLNILVGEPVVVRESDTEHGLSERVARLEAERDRLELAAAHPTKRAV
jgi:hypothetical protein